MNKFTELFLFLTVLEEDMNLVNLKRAKKTLFYKPSVNWLIKNEYITKSLKPTQLGRDYINLEPSTFSDEFLVEMWDDLGKEVAKRGILDKLRVEELAEFEYNSEPMTDMVIVESVPLEDKITV
jgi:hypothetical protein